MTPAQQAALENLVGRVLTPAELTDLTPLVDARNDVKLAETLSVGRIALRSAPMGIGTTLITLAGTGGAFLDRLVSLGTSDRNIFWALELIKDGTFDIGLPGTRAQMQYMMTSYPDLKADITKLLAIAEAPAPIAVSAVSIALNVAEGRMI